MNMKAHIALLACFTWVCVSSATEAQSWPQNEWSLSSGFGTYTEQVDFRTHFSPYQIGDRSASQHVRFRGEVFPMFSLGFTRWVSKDWGIALMGRISQTQWVGDHQPIPIHFTYNAWMPSPPYPEINVNRLVHSPERPEGSWTSYQAMLGVKRRFQSGRLEWVAQGSLVLDSTKEMMLENLYFENTIMISRGSLITSSLLMDLKSRQHSYTRVGASLALRASLPLSSSIRLFANANYVWLPSKQLKLKLESIEAISMFYNADTVEQVSNLAQTDAFRTPNGTVSIEVGLLLQY